MSDQLALASDDSTGALFSDDRRYRYALWRTWDPARPAAMFIGINPSTADETVDDLTIKKCIGFAKKHGNGGIVMCNLYAYRATDPKDLLTAGRPVGEFGDIYSPPSRNDRELLWRAQVAGRVIAAWGTCPSPLPHRAADVCEMLAKAGVELWCLGTTKDGHPRHPSRIGYAQGLVRWSPLEVAA